MLKQALLAAILLALSAISALAQSIDRPVCDRSRVGQFWPAVANEDKAAAQKLVRCGDLALCTRTSIRRYRWEQLSVTIEQLRSEKKNFTPSSTCSAISVLESTNADSKSDNKVRSDLSLSDSKVATVQ